jgi:hypothetical protein
MRLRPAAISAYTAMNRPTGAASRFNDFVAFAIFFGKTSW